MSASRGFGRWLPLVAFGALALLLGAGVWLSRQADRDVLPSPLIGKPAPAFSLPVLHEPGRMLTLEQLKGEPFVLTVWGSWCVSCRVEHPVKTRFAETRRVRVVGYDWKDEPADALAWLQQFGNPFWVVVSDYEGRYAIDWGIYGAPETYLVDAAGIIRWKHVGPLDDATVNGELLPALERVEAGARR
jgi:cytochrome c biogenesis protein CcmG/thiol:disulfide interchange protein DsbE